MSISPVFGLWLDENHEPHPAFAYPQGDGTAIVVTAEDAANQGAANVLEISGVAVFDYAWGTSFPYFFETGDGSGIVVQQSAGVAFARHAVVLSRDEQAHTRTCLVRGTGAANYADAATLADVLDSDQVMPQGPGGPDMSHGIFFSLAGA